MNIHVNGVVHFCSCACTCKFTGTLMFMHTHIQIQSHTLIFVHTHTWRYTCKCTGILTFMYTHVKYILRENEGERHLFVKVLLRKGVRFTEMTSEMFEEQLEWRYGGKI